MPDAARLTMLCTASEVRDDRPVRVERDGQAFAVFVVQGQYHVTQDECTHGPGSLAEGWEEGDCDGHAIKAKLAQEKDREWGAGREAEWGAG